MDCFSTRPFCPSFLAAQDSVLCCISVAVIQHCRILKMSKFAQEAVVDDHVHLEELLENEDGSEANLDHPLTMSNQSVVVKVIQEHMKDIFNSPNFEPRDHVGVLYSRNVISDSQAKQVEGIANKQERTKTLLSMLSKKDVAGLSVFIDSLRMKSHSTLAARLEKRLRELTSGH